jgi:hypothetical protein
MLLVVSFRLSSLALLREGTLSMSLPVQEAARDPGVYPFRVELRPRTGRAFDHFVSHLVSGVAPTTGSKLGVAFVLPLEGPVAPGQEDRLVLDAPASARLSALVGEFATHPSVPLTLRPAGPTLEALSTGARQPDAATLHALADEAKNPLTRQIMADTYVPIDLQAMTDDGLLGEVAAQTSRAGDVLASTLQSRPDPRTWVSDDPLGDDAVTTLTDRGVDRLVLPESSLVPVPQGLTATQPFAVEPQPGRRITAVAPDVGLAAHFAPTDDPVLAAHQLLADLAVIYFDAPGARTPRAVAAVPPRSWSGDPSFVHAVLDGLATSPLVSGITLDQLFSEVPVAASGRGRSPLVRRLTDPDVPASHSLPASSIRSTRQRLEQFGSFLDRDNDDAANVFDHLQRNLLLAESIELRPRTRENATDDVSRQIDQQTRMVRLTSAKTIQLTAKSGEIPVTIISDAPYPVHVILRLENNVLFPHGVERAVDITRRNTTTTFTVAARTSGAFSVRVSIEAPAGRLVIAESKLTVRSIAVSNLGLIASVGTGLFLLGWWGHNFRHGRRAKRLVPA